MRLRPLIEPILMTRVAPFDRPDPEQDFDVRDLYVRRYWTALLGPTAIADLLRMVQTAKRCARLRMPLTMPVLLAEGLAVRLTHRRYGVPQRVAALATHQLDRLPHALRSEARSYPG